jgi:uncharacterized membrane protein YkvA (DUF1232 family)
VLIDHHWGVAVMLDWPTGLGILVGAVAVSLGGIWVFARRRPLGSLKELTGLLPAIITTARRLRVDPRVPRYVKIATMVALVWLLFPIDLLPEFLPVIGSLDDVLVLVAAGLLMVWQVPREVLLKAWPGGPSSLERLLDWAASLSRRPAWRARRRQRPPR